jgi:methylenetetrahydrofolate--tRNA-(uracil-5-)-methyltransferase
VVIGGGLAGVEASLQLAARGRAVTLIEMRPGKMTPAHRTGDLAELVCSNSLKSDDPTTAAGLLKHELRALGSFVLQAAYASRVAAGGALAVDRRAFSAELERLIEAHPLITVERREATQLPATGYVLLATGPLTSDALTPVLAALTGEHLAFYDAAAPIVDADSIDRNVVFEASRYDKGGGADYLNAPMDRETYERFVDALVSAPRAKVHDFERRELFAACQPIEEIARTGADAMRYGPLKPVGLVDPQTGERPWAVVQLRAETGARTAYNLVGFQTNLTFGAQERVFRSIPGLEKAEFLRHGVMHRNTFVDAPRLLDPSLALRTDSRIHLAGQITGTEGYLEAAATGLLAALNIDAELRGEASVVLPSTTALGSLVAYATDPSTENYQPMHVNFGLVPPLPERVRGTRARYEAYSQRAVAALDAWLAERPGVMGERQEMWR